MTTTKITGWKTEKPAIREAKRASTNPRCVQLTDGSFAAMSEFWGNGGATVYLPRGAAIHTDEASELGLIDHNTRTYVPR